MIGILATGDELTTGEILNTNGKFIAQALFDHNIPPGMQLTVRDNQKDLEDAMHYLLDRHDALITIGGLGPTSDDRTRFALANVIGKELEFDEASWRHIENRLMTLKLDIPESNRQQCLFPVGSEVLINEMGTANSCYIIHNNKPIFMLPGPPRECKPIIEKHLLPKLSAHGLIKPLHKAHWSLLGVSESSIAESLDKIASHYGVDVGYRADVPYVEVKLFAHDARVFEQAQQDFLKVIKPYVVSDNRQTARDLLYNFIKNNNKKLTIIDNATKGYLACQLLSPDTYKKVTFPEHPMMNTGTTFIISGLHRYWEQQNSNLYLLDILVLEPAKPARAMQIKIPNRGQRSLHYASEYLCWKIFTYLNRNP